MEIPLPVEIQFSDDHRYIVYTITDPLNMNDLIAAYEQEKTFRDSVDHTVHSIVDMSRVSRIPPNWLTAKAGPGLTHPRSGVMLFVGLSSGLTIIIQTIMKIMRYSRMKAFKTRAEADAYMQELLREEEVSSRNS